MGTPLQGQATRVRFDTLKSSPDYQSLGGDEQYAIAIDFFDRQVASQAGFKDQAQADQDAIRDDFLQKYEVQPIEMAAVQQAPQRQQVQTGPPQDLSGNWADKFYNTSIANQNKFANDHPILSDLGRIPEYYLQGGLSGLSAQGYQPDNKVRRGAIGDAVFGASDFGGSVGGQIALSSVIGPVPAMSTYRAAGEINRQSNQGVAGQDINYGSVAGKGALGAVEGLLPLGARGDVLKRAGTGAALGLPVNLTDSFMNQATDNKTFDLAAAFQDPNFAIGMTADTLMSTIFGKNAPKTHISLRTLSDAVGGRALPNSILANQGFPTPYQKAPRYTPPRPQPAGPPQVQTRVEGRIVQHPNDWLNEKREVLKARKEAELAEIEAAVDYQAQQMVDWHDSVDKHQQKTIRAELNKRAKQIGNSIPQKAARKALDDIAAAEKATRQAEGAARKAANEAKKKAATQPQQAPPVKKQPKPLTEAQQKQRDLEETRTLLAQFIASREQETGQGYARDFFRRFDIDVHELDHGDGNWRSVFMPGHGRVAFRHNDSLSGFMNRWTENARAAKRPSSPINVLAGIVHRNGGMEALKAEMDVAMTRTDTGGPLEDSDHHAAMQEVMGQKGERVANERATAENAMYKELETRVENLSRSIEEGSTIHELEAVFDDLYDADLQKQLPEDLLNDIIERAERKLAELSAATSGSSRGADAADRGNPPENRGSKSATGSVKLPGFDGIKDHPAVKARPDIVKALTDSHDKGVLVKPKYSAEIVGQALGAGEASKPGSLVFEAGIAYKPTIGKLDGGMKTVTLGKDSITIRKAGDAVYDVIDGSKKLNTDPIALPDAQKTAVDKLKSRAKVEDGEPWFNTINADGQYRKLKLDDAEDGSRIHSIETLKEQGEFETFRDPSRPLQDGSPSLQIRNKKSGAAVDQIEVEEYRKTSDIAKDATKIEGIAKDASKNLSATQIVQIARGLDGTPIKLWTDNNGDVITLERATEAGIPERYFHDVMKAIGNKGKSPLKAALSKMPPDVRKKIHEIMTGEYC